MHLTDRWVHAKSTSVCQERDIGGCRHPHLDITLLPPPWIFPRRQAIVTAYLTECSKYGVEANSGVLVALRFRLPVLRPTKPFHCKVRLQTLLRKPTSHRFQQSPDDDEPRTRAGYDAPCRGAHAGPVQGWRSPHRNRRLLSRPPSLAWGNRASKVPPPHLRHPFSASWRPSAPPRPVPTSRAPLQRLLVPTPAPQLFQVSALDDVEVH